MDEQHYRQTYHQINQQRCVFEKGILARQCACMQARRFNLADREGVACQKQAGNQRCQRLLELMRQNANFALGLPKVDSPLPHNKELKIQIGGMQGLAQILSSPQYGQVDDINGLIEQAVTQFGSFEEMPFDEIVKSIVHYQLRKRRRVD